jgi:hypothetical protein
LCLSSGKITGTSEWIVMKFDTGEFNRIHRENTVLVIKEQRYHAHEDPTCFSHTVEAKKFRKIFVEKNEAHISYPADIFP